MLLGFHAALLWSFQDHFMMAFCDLSSKDPFYPEMIMCTIWWSGADHHPFRLKKYGGIGSRNHAGMLAAVTIFKCCHRDFCETLGSGGQGNKSYFIFTCSWESPESRWLQSYFWYLTISKRITLDPSIKYTSENYNKSKGIPCFLVLLLSYPSCVLSWAFCIHLFN